MGGLIPSRNYHVRAAAARSWCARSATPPRNHLVVAVDRRGRVQRFQRRVLPVYRRPSLSPRAGGEGATGRRSRLAWRRAIAMDIDISFAPVLDVGHIAPQSANVLIMKIRRSADDGASPSLTDARRGHGNHRQHFPGHGAGLPIRTKSARSIRGRHRLSATHDMAVFKSLIAEQRLDAIMPAMVYPEPDPRVRPAASAYWLKRCCAANLGFDGGFSDDLSDGRGGDRWAAMLNAVRHRSTPVAIDPRLQLIVKARSVCWITCRRSKQSVLRNCIIKVPFSCQELWIQPVGKR
ncbi:hypothetical protein LNP74_24410 [Klebsiella pneumoniae subsp. pneumoniae]|nr:hypothetical protein [Klebsiella pneumoniae subsp. pneumoniae]